MEYCIARPDPLVDLTTLRAATSVVMYAVLPSTALAEQSSGDVGSDGGDWSLAGGKTAVVDQSSIGISTNKTLSFDAVTTGFGEGEELTVTLQSGSALDLPGGAISDPRFSDFADVTGVVHNRVASFSYPLGNLQDTYLRITIPGLQQGPPPIVTFGAQGGISPCGGASPCQILFGYGGAGRN